MKEFELYEAMQGAELCDRNGHKAVISNYNGRGERPLIGYIEHESSTIPCAWYINGQIDFGMKKRPGDLMICDKQTRYALHDGEGLITPVKGQYLFRSIKDIEEATGCQAYELNICTVQWNNAKSTK